MTKAGSICLPDLGKGSGRQRHPGQFHRPGLIDTPMNNNLSQEEKSEITSYLASKRMGTPEDIASLASFLLSGSASYINGQVITVDGGYL